MMTRNLTLATMLLAAAGAAFAQATITQEKALAGDVTPGDAPGFPIKISQPGHYKLMSNLVVPADTSGIDIAADDVTIDLNGFRVIGAGTCTWKTFAPVTGCQGNTTSSAGIGTMVKSMNVAVRNGTVRGFFYGLRFSSGRVEDVHLSQNQYGVLTDLTDGFIATRLVMDGNATGAYLGCGALLQSSVATRNIRGIEGCGTVIESQVNTNGTGLRHVKYRGVRFNGNATDTDGAQVF